jgi:predicted O-methyltransferase YrrM
MISKLARTLLPLEVRDVLRPYFYKLRKSANVQQSIEEIREIIAPLGEPFSEVLCSMYKGEPQLGTGGRQYPIDYPLTNIPPREGMFLYRLIREVKPAATLEIGLAYGFSTTYMLAALHANGSGHHTAVDQFDWHGIGGARDQALGLHGVFEWCKETSAEALSRFAKEQRQFGVIFIDGDHKFDGVMVDFSLATNVCSGYIVFDDMWMPAVQRVVAFIRSNRKDFSEVPAPIPAITIFQKTGKDNRTWDDFVSF